MNRGIKFRGVRRLAPTMGLVVLALSCTAVSAGATTRVAHTTYANTLACEVTDTGGINDNFQPADGAPIDRHII